MPDRIDRRRNAYPSTLSRCWRCGAERFVHLDDQGRVVVVCDSCHDEEVTRTLPQGRAA